MKIELRSIQMIPAMSGPFDAFTARLFIDGTYAADVQNGGRDLVNKIDAINEKGKALVAAAEQYRQKLPQKRLELNGETRYMKMNLGKYIDDLVTGYLVEQAEKNGTERLTAK